MNNFLSYFKNKKAELITSFLYIVLLSIVAYFHEPWFDEAQAWLISKVGSLWDIIYSFSKTEGHLPLWYLLLAPFSKLGFPYELTIKFINITICSIAVIIMTFKAPFNKFIKCCIPFTYFIFYQYGIINRCYCLLLLGIVLVALTYNNRDIKPLKFALSLIFFAFSSAYSIVIGFAITLVWLFEIYQNYKSTQVFKDVRIRYVALVWFVYFLLGLILLPANGSGNFLSIDKVFLINFALMLFVIPLSSILYDPFEYGHISLDPISSAKLIFCLLIGISFFIILLFVLKRYKKMWFFLIPYLFFAAFSAKVYFYMHHQAIVVLFLIFIAWVTVEDKNKLNSRNSNNYNKTLKEIGLLGIYLCLFVSIYWSVTASVNDIKYPYSWARETAKFLKDYNLEHHHILSAYNPPFKENGKMVFNTNEINSAEIYPYFEDNIISNFYIRPYLLHQRGNWKDEYEKLRKRKMPDIILNGGFDIASIYGIQAPQHYILARLHPVNRIWKAKRYQMAFPVYMEEKIYKEKILKQ